MAKCEIVAGSIDQTIDVFIQDSSVTTGAGLTGLVFNTSNLVCYYRKGATGTPTALTLATQTVGGAHSDGGFVAVDGTNCPGQYRLDLSDTIVAAAGRVTLYLKGAANMAPCLVEIEVVAVNKFDAVRGGMTALPNANAEAAGGLITRGTGTGQLTVSSGAVTVGTNNDKTGYSLSQSFPANFAALGINASGHVSRVTLADTLTTYTGNTPQTGDSYARLGAPGLSTVSADIGAVSSTLGTVATSAASAASSAGTAATIVSSGTYGNSALKTLIDAKPTAAQLLATAVATSNTANTVGDCLNAARAQGFGKWVLNSGTKVMKLYAPDGTTEVASFDIAPDLTAPLTRTPQ